MGTDVSMGKRSYQKATEKTAKRDSDDLSGFCGGFESADESGADCAGAIADSQKKAGAMAKSRTVGGSTDTGRAASFSGPKISR